MPTLGSFINEGVRLYGDSTALVFRDRRKSFKEVNERMNRYANALLVLGLQRGDRVALMQYNSDKWIEGFGAQAKIGICTVPVNARLSADEAAWILNDSEANAFVFRENLIGLADRIKPMAPTVEHFICVSDEPVEKPDYMLDFDELIAGAGPADPPVKAELEDMILMMYTSGTTGKPKGVISCHDNFTQGMIVNHLVNQLRDMKKGDKYLAVTPLTHMAQGFVWPTWIRGGTTVILDQFNPEDYLRTIEKEKVNYSILAPTLIIMLSEHPGAGRYDLSSLKLIWYAASPMPTAAARRAVEVFGPVFAQMYGLTENQMVCTMLLPEDHLKKPGSCGHVMVNCEVRVAGKDGRELPPGEPGELVIRTPGIMKGYWKNPVATRDTLVNGWLHSGDIGRMDKDGYFYIMDRKKDMIISGGFNVYPAEVEDCLFEHPAVQAACVIGVPDPKWVEAVKAVVVLRPGDRVTAEELIQHCKDRIAHFKAPKTVHFVEDLPVSATGKVLRRVVREKYTRLGVNY